MQEEEEAELYDPDDPASDWGQAVQEALQDLHVAGDCRWKFGRTDCHPWKVFPVRRNTNANWKVVVVPC